MTWGLISTISAAFSALQPHSFSCSLPTAPFAAAVAATIPDKPPGSKYRHQWFQSPERVEVRAHSWVMHVCSDLAQWC